MDQDQTKNQTQRLLQKKELVTLGGGCFWCLEPIFKELMGVEQVVAGYSGGTVPDPSYRQVCTGTTGHAEVVQITFDPEEISFRKILEVFFAVHDPTTPNRQGADIGSQYRSVVFYHNEEQEKIAKSLIQEVGATGVWDEPVVTEIAPFKAFYKAEDYHQDYFSRNPEQAYCRLVIAPKVTKFQSKYGSKLKSR